MTPEKSASTGLWIAAGIAFVNGRVKVSRKRCARPVVSGLRRFGLAILQLRFAGGLLWSTKMSTGWRFSVARELRA